MPVVAVVERTRISELSMRVREVWVAAGPVAPITPVQEQRLQGMDPAVVVAAERLAAPEVPRRGHHPISDTNAGC
jgi:hypothetical protein